jgi:hypothetical protein
MTLDARNPRAQQKGAHMTSKTEAPTHAQAYAALAERLLDPAQTPRQADFARGIGMVGKSLRDVTRSHLGVYVSRGGVFSLDVRTALLAQPRVRVAIARTLGCEVADLPPVPDTPTA